MKLSRGIYDSVGIAAPVTSRYLPSAVVHYKLTDQLTDYVWNLRRIYTFALWMCIEDDSSSVKVNDASWSIYTFQWFNSFH